MKIKIITSEGKNINIPLPMWLIKVCSSKRVTEFIKNNSNDKDIKALEMIDFDVFKYNLDYLNQYKGLEVVDIDSKDGTKVKIIV